MKRKHFYKTPGYIIIQTRKKLKLTAYYLFLNKIFMIAIFSLFNEKITVSIKIYNSMGFTLTELMVTLCIIVLLATIGIPNLLAMLPNIRLNASVRQIIEDLMLVRSQSISKKYPYIIYFTTNTKYWIVKDKNFNNFPERDEIIATRDLSKDFPGVTIGNASVDNFSVFKVNFDPRGIISAISIPVQIKTKTKKIVINFAGHIRVE